LHGSVFGTHDIRMAPLQEGLKALPPRLCEADHPAIAWFDGISGPQ